ncbi:hypothetical protein BP6252_09977 [Coleophoma cylindrospora]|uniref:Heterokaryon incompatibility domain-containing protein n=1 Tax=Coleophoma cylindrospora TaxID=1849047 RepID=A0A3D8QX26_9HELO|nr:hypothetical protein BP6252_09977 [Coleophoma cylindrospora]
MFKQLSGVLENVLDDCKYSCDPSSPSVTNDDKACPSSAPLTAECRSVADVSSIAPSTIIPENTSHALQENASGGKTVWDRCYPEIDKNTRDIRLLVLLPMRQPTDGRIQFNLVTVSLHNPPSYDALSYTWGEPDNLHKRVWVNGVLVEVRENLHDALEALYATCNGKDRLLWIDALCINQINLLERNHQVKIMGSIYSTAQQVLVWLGRPSVDTSEDTLVLRSYSEIATVSLKPGLDLVKEAIKHLGHWNFDNDRFKTTFGLAYPYHNGYLSHWEHLAELCSVGYWRRLWIVQECGLAKTIRILYGCEAIEWYAFSSLRQWLDNNPLGSPGHGLPQRLDEAIRSIKDSMPAQLDRQWRYPQLVPSLQNLLFTCKYSVCRDPRDKIYGLLGLAKDVTEGDIRIDYQKTPLELYESVLHFYRNRPRAPTCLRLDEPQINMARFSQLVLQILQSGSKKYNSLNSSIEKLLGPAKGPREKFKTDAFGPENITIWRKWNVPSEVTVHIPILDPRTQTPINPLRWKEKWNVNTEKLSAVLDIGGYSDSKKLVLITGANGDIGLAPDCIRATDFLCRLIDCDGAAVIVRATYSSDEMRNSYQTICRVIMGRWLSRGRATTNPLPPNEAMPELGLLYIFLLWDQCHADVSSTAFHTITRSYDWSMLNEYADFTRISREMLPIWFKELKDTSEIPVETSPDTSFANFESNRARYRDIPLILNDDSLDDESRY